MRLVPVGKENQHFYKKFEDSEDLSLYMSRIYPYGESSYLKWMYIEEDRHYVGSIWLEGKDIQRVKLGVFIAEPAYRDRGLGKQAIQQIIGMAQNEGIHVITLNVRAGNARAIKAYTACGFKIKKSFSKENGIDAFSMDRELGCKI